MKLVKIVGIIIIVILVIVMLLLIASLVNHKSKLSKEAKTYPPPGRIVEVEQTKMHVYTAGKGNFTLVFMAGHGTSNPTIDFKPLWARLVDEYRIAVVEKPGYGWSETSNRPRDIDTMLEETRKALELSGEKAPYVLFPHSMSGLEALYWAQKYPHEVKAIIGLDSIVPETVKLLPIPPKFQLNLLYFVSRIGLSRFMPESEVVKSFPLLKSDELSEGDKVRYVALFYKSALTKDMLREMEYLEGNAETVNQNGVPFNIPMYYFISHDQEAIAPGWGKAIADYISQIALGKSMQLATGHYVHHEKADIIVREAKMFLKKL